jgi:glucose-6-phosphate 1-dehydrogenase
MTETFVSLKLFSKDPNWLGVPITITTGKALDKKNTEIRIIYKKDTSYSDEDKKDTFGEGEGPHAEAYERVFIDAMKGDHRLFVTSEEVLASWRILEPIQKAWEDNKTELKMYPQGSTVADVCLSPNAAL